MSTKYYSRSFSIFLLFIDLILIDLIFIAAHALRFDGNIFKSEEYMALLVLTDLIWIIAAFYNEVYLFSKVTQLRNSALKLLSTFLLHAFLISLCFVAFKAYVFSRLVLLYFYLFSFTVLFALRVIYYIITRQYYKTGFNAKKSVIIGTGNAAMQLYEYFAFEKSSGYKFVGFFDDYPNKNCPQELVKGKIYDAPEFCLKEDISEIFYAKDLTDTELIKDLTEYADQNFKYLRFVPDFRGLQKSKFDISFYNDVPVINYTKAPLGGFFNQMVKRAFDIGFSLMVILFIFPFIFPIIAILIKLESKGPVFFKQLRPGKGNKLFECYKFRTMRVNGSTEKQATKDDPRITKTGAILRKTSLDELPQFFNVLKGNMSVVGPRPNMISQLEYYSKEIDKYNFRHFITPGITGYAQVNGFRGETKDIMLMKKRVEYDAWYIENWNLTLDIKIILLTVWSIFKGDEYAY